MGTQSAPKRYSAFVSYRHHAVDRSHAIQIMRALESFSTPTSLRKEGYPQRLEPVYRDDDEAGVHDTLSAQLQESLTHSQVLLVICSPRTKDSIWVQREVEFFRGLGRGKRIIPVVVDGAPAEVVPDYLGGPEKASWDSDQPLALDIRPREDESPRATFRRAVLRIAAAVLECNFDDLAQRAETQRRRRRFQLLAGVLAAIAVLGVGGLAWWDAALRVKAEYFANVSERWGVPVGVGPLSGEVRRHRGNSFRLSRRGGRVVELALVNSYGVLSDDTDYLDEPWNADVARWRYASGGDGGLSVTTFDETDTQLGRYEFDFAPDRSYAVMRAESEVAGVTERMWAGASVLGGETIGDTAGGDLTVQRSLAGQHRLTFDDTGLVVRRLFEPLGGGAPTPDASGVAGRAYSYNSDGLPTEIRNIGPDGQPDQTQGRAVLRQASHSPGGEIISVQLRSAAGLLVAGESGARTTIERDRFGNVTGERYFDANGAPAYGKDGFSRFEVRHDDRGNAVELAVYDAADALTYAAGGSGAAVATFEYDNNGRLAAGSYLDIDRQPMLARDTRAATLRYERDGQGRVLRERAFGATGEPILRKDNGAFEVRYSYDRRGNQIEEALYDKEGRPTLHSTEGWAIGRGEYDEQGRLVGGRFYDAAGHPALNDVCSHGFNLVYDERGNMSAMRTIGPDGRSVMPCGENRNTEVRLQFDGAGRATGVSAFDASGVVSSSARMEYDAFGRLTYKSFFDAQGRPMVSREAHAHAVRFRNDLRGEVIEQTDYGPGGEVLQSFRIRSDDRGQPIEFSVWNADGSPVASREIAGAHVSRFQYDERGRSIREELFNTQNQIESIAQFQRDHWGREIEVQFLSPTGELVPGGDLDVETLRTTYDARGNVIERSAFDAAGRPTLTAEGWAVFRERYDERDRLIESSAIGVDGRQTMDESGFVTIRMSYDARGNMVERSAFGADGRPAEREGTGIARWTWAYDARDNQVEERAYGIDGALRENDEDGVAMFRWTHDSAGRVTQESAYGADGRYTDDLSVIRHRRNQFGEIVETSFFGPDGRPTPNGRGAVVRRIARDAFGRCLSQEEFGPGGASLGATTYSPPRSC